MIQLKETKLLKNIVVGPAIFEEPLEELSEDALEKEKGTIKECGSTKDRPKNMYVIPGVYAKSGGL